MFQSGMAVISTATAAEVARGVSRLLLQEGYSPILEFTLANGRRLDVAALGPDGTVLGVEIKVAVADLKGDTKWPDYLEFCELFYFAIPPDFPDELVPPDTGLIVADRYGGAIVRPSRIAQIHASRRTACLNLGSCDAGHAHHGCRMKNPPKKSLARAGVTVAQLRKTALSFPG